MSKNKYIIPVFIPHEGCPHDCSFCNQKKIAGTSDKVTIEKLENTIETYLKIYEGHSEGREIAFYGGSFTGLPMENQKQYLSVAFRYKKRGLVDGIRLSTRPDYIDEAVLTQLKFYGVTTIELGVQSTNDDVLRMNSRGHDRNDVFNAVRKVREHEFKLGLQMMVGLFGDNEEGVHHTARDLVLLKPDFVRIYPTLVIRGTDLEKYYYEGRYKPLLLEKCIDICKDLLLLFEDHAISVIRLGLQSTEEITYGKSVIAGPYHPALRELVESQVFRSKIQTLLDQKEMMDVKGGRLTVNCHPRSTSKVAGHNKSNKIYFLEKYKLTKFTIKTDENMYEKEVRVEVTTTT